MTAETQVGYVPWVNLDDNMPDNPKVAGLTDGAFRLYVSGICYCNRHRTDGLIDEDEVPRLVRRFRPTALRELTDRGLWFHHDSIKAYVVRDYLEWNRSRAEIEEFSELQRQRVMKRWHKK